MNKIRMALTALMVMVASGATGAVDALYSAKSLKCVIGRGTATEWVNGEPRSKADRADMDLFFDSIDHRTGKARLIGNQAAGTIAVFVTGGGLTFMERTTFGNFLVTTVFPVGPKKKEFYAVHSRHIFSDEPVPSQYHGICKIWE